MTYFKGFDEKLQCYNGFQFEVGKTYDTGYKEKLTDAESDLCTRHVFHFCDSIENVTKFYPLNKKRKNRICEVEPLDEIISDNSKCGSTKIKIIREITGEEFDYLVGNGSNESLMKRFHELYDGKTLNNLDIVQVGRKFNYADGEGSVISPNQWFDNCHNFKFNEQYAEVILDDYECNVMDCKCNIIDCKGKLISKQWFDWINKPDNGSYYKVCLNGKSNFLDLNGKYVSDIWFDWCDFFTFKDGKGRACVKLNNKIRTIDLDANTSVKLNTKMNYIDLNGRLISDLGFDWCENFIDGIAKVCINDKENFLDLNGEIISPYMWFDDCRDFQNGYSKVILNYKFNFINQRGELLSDIWFDDCGDFHNGFSCVELDGEFNFMKQSGELLSDIWFDECGDIFHNGLSVVKLNKKYNYIDKSGNLILKKYVDYCEREGFFNHYIEEENFNYSRYRKIIKGNKFNYIDIMTHQLISDNWIKMPIKDDKDSFYISGDDKFLVLRDDNNCKEEYEIIDNKVKVKNTSFIDFVEMKLNCIFN